MLDLITKMTPKPSIVVFGTGGKSEPLPKVLKEHIIKLGIQVESCNSKSAASIFNILVAEGRNPSAAFLPMFPTSARTGKALVNINDS
jgi:uncharacterized protein